MWFEVDKRVLEFLASKEYASGWWRFIRIFLKSEKFFMHDADAYDAGYHVDFKNVLGGVDVSTYSLEVGAKEFILNLEEICKEELALPP